MVSRPQFFSSWPLAHGGENLPFFTFTDNFPIIVFKPCRNIASRNWFSYKTCNHTYFQYRSELRIQKTLRTVYWKTPIFQSKQPMTRKHHISLNSQFTVVLNVSVQFCDNSLSVLKMHFQVYPFASRKVQEFSSDRKILMLLISVLFHLENVFQFFEILVFS